MAALKGRTIAVFLNDSSRLGRMDRNSSPLPHHGSPTDLLATTARPVLLGLAFLHGRARWAARQCHPLVTTRCGVDPDEFARKHLVGKAQQPHSLLARSVRWHQQTLKHAGVLECVEGDRGVWQLTRPAQQDLNSIQPGVAVVGFSTDLGVAILATCDSVFSRIDCPITLCLTSPPYPLAKARSYGNPSEGGPVC